MQRSYRQRRRLRAKGLYVEAKKEPVTKATQLENPSVEQLDGLIKLMQSRSDMGFAEVQGAMPLGWTPPKGFDMVNPMGPDGRTPNLHSHVILKS